jgi:hypothetical protein
VHARARIDCRVSHETYSVSFGPCSTYLKVRLSAVICYIYFWSKVSDTNIGCPCFLYMLYTKSMEGAERKIISSSRDAACAKRLCQRG